MIAETPATEVEDTALESKQLKPNVRPKGNEKRFQFHSLQFNTLQKGKCQRQR